MKRSTMALIVAAVVAVHAVFFYLIADFKPLPHKTYIPPQNFTSGSAHFTDPRTHEKMIYQEFTVRTNVERDTAGLSSLRSGAPVIPH